MNNDSNTRFNQVRQKSSHNAYKRLEGLSDQALYWRIRSIELDLHNGKDCSSRRHLTGNWYVYHECRAGDADTSVDKLSDALVVLLAFANAVPDHEVITVFLDMKDEFNSSTHTPDQLDELISTTLGRDRIWGPPDLIASSGQATLQAAVTLQGFPFLADLRGKIVFILTGGGLGSGSKLSTYISNGIAANSRIAFVAPKITSTDDYSNWPYAIFFNLDSSSRHLGPTVFSDGYMSRTYLLNDRSNWNKAFNEKTHFLATDKVNTDQDSWSSTSSCEGYPFQGIEVGLDAGITEPGNIYGIQVSSGDMWGSADSFYFAYNVNASPDATWVAFVGSPGSHVNQWAKGGIMARVSTDADSAYFAVIRPAANKLRVQFREKPGEDTKTTSVDIVGKDTVDEKDVMWIKLVISDNGTTATGYGSLVGDDDESWQQIATHTFTDCGGALGLQGWCASSHGDESVKFLFGTQSGAEVILSTSEGIPADKVTGKFFQGVNAN